MKKKAFLLLEILITFVLVSVCAVPLVKQPLKLYKDEMVYLVGMEQERLADWTFTEIKEMLLKNEIPWEKIPEKKIETGPFLLPSALIDIPGCKPKTVERRFTLKGRGEKMGLHDEVYRHIGICIFLNNKKYRFRLPIQKLLVE